MHNVAVSVCLFVRLFAGFLQFYAYIFHSGVHQSSPSIYETCEAQAFALAARRNQSLIFSPRRYFDGALCKHGFDRQTDGQTDRQTDRQTE